VHVAWVEQSTLSIDTKIDDLELLLVLSSNFFGKFRWISHISEATRAK